MLQIFHIIMASEIRLVVIDNCHMFRRIVINGGGSHSESGSTEEIKRRRFRKAKNYGSEM